MRFQAALIPVLSLCIVACSAGGTPFEPEDASGPDVAVDAQVVDARSDTHDTATSDAPDATRDTAADAPSDESADGAPMCSGSGTDPYPMDNAPGEYTDPAACPSPPCPDVFQNFTITPNADHSVATVTGYSPHALTCSFVVVSTSCGAESGTLGLDPDTGNFSGPVPLFCGTNTVKIICTNGTYHRIHVVDVDGRECAGDDLRLTLTWDSNVRDGELHLIRMPSTINNSMNDCTWTTCIMPRVLDWGVAGVTTDNPVKDVDNTSTNGTEHITLSSAPAGTYAIMAEHWNPTGTPGMMTMEINVQGRTPVVQTVASIAEHWVWFVGEITFPGGTFTPTADLPHGHTPELTNCTSNWTFPGCGLPIPQ